MLAVSGASAGGRDLLGACRRTGCSRARRQGAVHQDGDGSFIDAATGKPAPDVMASGLKPVRVNNAVRGAIDAALGSLRLFAPDAGDTLDAAEAVFNSHDPAALPALERALAHESDAGVKHRMEQARAAALLFADGSSEAGSAGRDRGAARSAAISTAAACSRRCRRSRRPSRRPPLRRSPRSTRDLQLWSIVQSVYYGLSLGSVLLLAAAGLAITFGVMGVINMAHGEMVMIGAYVTFMVQQAIRDSCARPVRRQPADRRAARVHRRRADRHRDRAHADPLAVWPAAGDAAGDLGAVADAAAGGALAVRRRTTATSARPTG